MALTIDNLRQLRVSIIGAAREGVALARFLAHCGARVTLSDSQSAEQMRGVQQELGQLPIRLCFGSAPADLLEVDVLFLSPGVPPYAPIVQEARGLGLPISSEPRLFCQLCQAPIVGITGSSGKTTTTALTGRMYAASGRTTWVGGNIGVPLTDRLIDLDHPEAVVMELSSFQLELFSPDYQGVDVDKRRSPVSRAVSTAGWSPAVAAITNITPNHLDRHPSMEDYARAKSHILTFQDRADWAVLNADDARTSELARTVKGHLLRFSLEQAVDQGAYLDGDRLLAHFDGDQAEICNLSEIKLRGRHNIANVLAAACCAMAGGVELAAIRQAISTFTGVAHRLESVRTLHGVTYVNDSIATSPERAIAALRAYEQPLVLLAGGRDKHLPWDEWAGHVWQKARAVIAFGEAMPIICQSLEEYATHTKGQALIQPTLYTAATMEDAFAQAAAIAQAGDVVLLSPGGTSFDAFKDFEERGQQFRDLVNAL